MGIHHAAQEFHALTSKINHSSDPRVRSALMRIEPLAQCHLAAASVDSLSFFKQVGDSLLRLRGIAQSELRTSLLRACSYYLFLTGRPRDALTFAQHGLELARRSSRKADVRVFHTLMGAVHGELGELQAAIFNHHRALEIAIELSELQGEVVCWNNISALLLDAGMYVESISAGRRALLLLGSTPSDEIELRARCETNIALAFHRLGEPQAAIEYAKCSIGHSLVPANGRQAQGRIIREANIASVYVDLGDAASAKLHATAARTLAKRFPNEKSLALAGICDALVDVFAGDADLGILNLEKWAKDPNIHSLSPIHIDLLLALVKAFQLAGRHEDALRYLEKLIESLSNARMANVLDEISKFEELRDVDTLHLANANLRAHELDAARLRQKVAEREVLQSRLEILERMAIAADIREDISGEHGFRVGRLSAFLAREIGWDRDACAALDIAARLHDIGKIGIPEKILLDEKTLRDAEKQFIATHTRVGAEILSKSDIPQVRIAEEIARCHHEAWDGNGYPKQLKGKDIPRSARIVALADVFDAMTHGRPYAPARSIEDALEFIASQRGRQFDPELTDHFLALVRRLARENENLDTYLGKAARHSPFLKARARIKELLAQERDSSGLSPSPRPPGVSLN